MCKVSGLLGGLWQQHSLYHALSLAERTADKSQLPSPGQSFILYQLADRVESQSAEMCLQGFLAVNHSALRYWVDSYACCDGF